MLYTYLRLQRPFSPPGTLTLICFLFLLLPEFSFGQTVTTIREINAIPEENIAVLEAAGSDLDRSTILANIFNDFNGQEVEIVAVVLSNPRNSGLANVDQDGRVSRVHMYVRDTSAVSQGVEGMGLQIVDPNYDANTLLDYAPGDILKIIGTVAPFGTVMQMTPTSVELVGYYVDLGFPESILDPVVVTSEQVNASIGADSVQVNWSNLADLRGQYIRLTNAEVVREDLSNPDRPDFYVSSDDGTTIVNFYDMGVQFRNDRDDYPQTFLVPDSDFVPPPLQSVVDIQGFLSFQNGGDQIGNSVPSNALLSISPFERRGCTGDPVGPSCDLAIAVVPPIVSNFSPLDIIPNGTAPVQLSFEAMADPLRTLDRGFCEYFTSQDEMIKIEEATDTGAGFTCSIPPQLDTTFVRVRAGASDDAGATDYSDYLTYVTLFEGINEVADIQRTFDTTSDSSPVIGGPWSMDITAVVTSQPDVSGFYVLQDKEDLSPWSGILLENPSTELQLGDQIQITSAEVVEDFSVTTLRNATYSLQSTGNAVFYKPTTTTNLRDPIMAEAHESMMLRFVDVTLGANPDFPSNFGEWTFTSFEDDFIRADDRSDAFSSDFSATLVEGSLWDYIQGIWWYSFGNYKLVPESPTEDITPQGAAAVPTFTGTPNLETSLCSIYQSSVMATGTPRPNYSLVEPLEGMTIVPLTGEIEWFPTAPGTYEITIDANSGLFSRTQTFSLLVDSIRAEISVDRAFMDAEQLSSYRLVSLPGTSRLPVASTFSGNVGEDWFFFRDNGTMTTDSSAYLEAEDGTFTFNTGQGYWALSNSNWQLPATQTALPIEDQCSHTLQLQEGWNVIGNPFPHEISWNEIQALSNSNHVLWRFEEGVGQWTADSTLTPYEGYYVYSDSPASLLIPYLDTDSSTTIPTVDSEYIELLATLADDTLSTVRILFSEHASLSQDSLDQVAPRNAFQPLSLRFLLDEDEDSALITESRPYLTQGQRLRLDTINKTEENAQLRLGDVNLSTSPGLLLVDRERGLGFNLTSQTRINIPPGSQRYLLIIGDNPTASDIDTEGLPTELTLSQNYPNPFNGGTTIEYSLPQDEWVTIEVYDVLGRRVDTLVDKFQAAGAHSVVWSNTQDMASGVYVYKLAVGSTIHSKTMLLSR